MKKCYHVVKCTIETDDYGLPLFMEFMCVKETKKDAILYIKRNLKDCLSIGKKEQYSILEVYSNY
jgi:hypothetical protein